VSLVRIDVLEEHVAFKKVAIDLAPQQRLCWFHYMDDTFVIWSHRPHKLKNFLNHLNSIHQCIQFTMETKKEGCLPFLDIDIYRGPDGSLSHRVYSKPTHTNLCLNVRSHHHPSNKQSVLSTLLHRARALSDEDSLLEELVFLRDVFRQNSYNNQRIHSVLNCLPNIVEPDNKPSSITFLTYVGPVFNQISRVLAQHIMMSVGLPHKKRSTFFWPVEGNLGLRIPGVY
jgi:hypothetical protein